MDGDCQKLLIRTMLGFCRSMFSVDLGHPNTEEVLKRTWREFAAFLAELCPNGQAALAQERAAALDRRLAELVGARIEQRTMDDGAINSTWLACPLWDEMKALRLEKAFTCVGACDCLSSELARSAEGATFERGNRMPWGGPCEKVFGGD